MLPVKDKTVAAQHLNQTRSNNNNKHPSTAAEGKFTEEKVTEEKGAMVYAQMLESSASIELRHPQQHQTSSLRSPTDTQGTPTASELKLTTQSAFQQKVKINTSNPGKFSEFSRLFSQHDVELEASHIDLDEIDADPISVVVHKASQLPPGCLVEDTSLDVAGADMGVNVRWLSEDLPKYLGKPAVWRTLLAIREDEAVSVYQGEISGVIVAPKGDQGFGFDPYFLPDGQSLTLAQNKPDKVNARAKAIDAYCQQKVFAKRLPIMDWEGPWQKH